MSTGQGRRAVVLQANDPHAIDQALRVLRAGGLVAFPTDTVYGLGALAINGNAVEALYTAKDRPLEKAIPILMADAGEMTKVASSIPLMAGRLAARFWPGPLTLVVPRHPDLPAAVSDRPTVGVRVPNHPVALALLRAAGPMAVTSANLSGNPSPVTAREVLAQLGLRIALILDGGRTPGGLASTVVDCTREEPVILRKGPLALKDLLPALV